jgi:hypothetical protein
VARKSIRRRGKDKPSPFKLRQPGKNFHQHILLSRAALALLIRETPIHPAADVTLSVPPFQLQD